MWFNYSPSKHLRWVLKSLGLIEIKRLHVSEPHHVLRGCPEDVRPDQSDAWPDRPQPPPAAPWLRHPGSYGVGGGWRSHAAVRYMSVALCNQAHRVFLFLVGTTIIKVFSSLLKTCAIRNSLSTWRYPAENIISPPINSFSPCVVPTSRICS